MWKWFPFSGKLEQKSLLNFAVVTSFTRIKCIANICDAICYVRARIKQKNNTHIEREINLNAKIKKKSHNKFKWFMRVRARTYLFRWIVEISMLNHEWKHIHNANYFCKRARTHKTSINAHCALCLLIQYTESLKWFSHWRKFIFAKDWLSRQIRRNKKKWSKKY